MKAKYKLNERLEVENDVADAKELFAFLASVAEVFSICECGACKSKNIRPVVRNSSKGKQTFTYYELHCLACKSKLALGQLADGSNGLFPKRKDEDGKLLDNGGWSKWTPEHKEE